MGILGGFFEKKQVIFKRGLTDREISISNDKLYFIELSRFKISRDVFFFQNSSFKHGKGHILRKYRKKKKVKLAKKNLKSKKKN